MPRSFLPPISVTGAEGGVLTGRTVVGSGERGLTIESQVDIDGARLLAAFEHWLGDLRPVPERTP